MYGTQTKTNALKTLEGFENDVKMYGTQTGDSIEFMNLSFENDVKMYGTQTLQTTSVPVM